MGLNGFQTTILIVLPQALRVVIPAIVGQFIALFMDTTLAVIVGLLELLAIGRSILNSNPKWLLLDMEVYGFIALVFWIFTFSMALRQPASRDGGGAGEAVSDGSDVIGGTLHESRRLRYELRSKEDLRPCQDKAQSSLKRSSSAATCTSGSTTFTCCAASA